MVWRDDAAAPESVDPLEIALSLGGAALTLALIAALAIWTRAELRARPRRSDAQPTPGEDDATSHPP